MIKYLHLLIFISIVSGLLVGCALFPRSAESPQPKKINYQPQKTAPLTAADEIENLLNNVRTMTASFEQTTSNKKNKSIGSMMLERPGKFRWKIIKPNKQLVIVNKNQSIFYDVDLNQAVKRKVNYHEPSSPAMLLSGSTGSLKKSFNIIKLKKDWFELSPKNKKNSYQKITIHFFDGKPKTMEITDNLDQKSTIVFKNIKLNIKISKNMFLFNPPKGVDILNAS